MLTAPAAFPTPARRFNRNILLFLLVCLVWGLTWIPVKVGSEHVPPIFLAAMRFVIAGPLMLLMAPRSRWLEPIHRLPELLISGLLLNTVCYALLVSGIRLVPTGLAAIVNMALIPVFVSMFGWIFREETLDRRRAIAIALGIVGLAILYAPGIPGSVADDPRIALGLAAIVGATASYSLGAILSRPLVRDVDTVALAGWQTIIGAIGLGIVSASLESVGLVEFRALLDWPTNLSLAFLVVAGSLIGFTLYVRLLRDWGAFRAGLYAFVSPAIAVCAGILVLHEPFGWHEAFGSVVMFAAAALAVTAKRPAARSDE